MDENCTPHNLFGKLISICHKVPYFQHIDSGVSDSPKEWKMTVRYLVENEAEWVTPSDAVNSLGSCFA